MFKDHFITTGDFSRSFLVNLKVSENLRDKSDYKDLFKASPADAKEQIKNASLFLDESVKFLEKKLEVSFENKITNDFGPER